MIIEIEAMGLPVNVEIFPGLEIVPIEYCKNNENKEGMSDVEWKLSKSNPKAMTELLETNDRFNEEVEKQIKEWVYIACFSY